MNQVESGDEERLGERREIFSSESRRSFDAGQGAEPAARERLTKPKSKRAPDADETKPAKDETSLTANPTAEPKSSPSASAGAVQPQGDEPPPTLDKSVDEGPL